MSIFPILKNKHTKVSLLLDIGNGSVSGALVRFGKDTLPEVIHVSTATFPVVSTPDVSQLSTTLFSLIENLLDTITHEHPGSVDSAMISFSSPWFESKVKNIHIVQDQTFVITKHFITDIQTKELEIFEQELATRIGNTDKDLHVAGIESEILSAKINGYNISDMLDKKTKMFDVSLYMSVIEKNISDKLFSIVSKHLHISERKIVAHTFPYITHQVVEKLFPDLNNYLVMDITGEITDVTMICDSAVAGSTSFPSGRNFLLRKIAQGFDVSPEIAESTLHMYTLNTLDDSMKEKLETIIANVGSEWSIYFDNAITELSSKGIVSSQICVTVEEDVFEIYKKFLQQGKGYAQRDVSVIYLHNDVIGHLYRPDLKTPINDYVGMLAIFHNERYT